MSDIVCACVCRACVYKLRDNSYVIETTDYLEYPTRLQCIV